MLFDTSVCFQNATNDAQILIVKQTNGYHYLIQRIHDVVPANERRILFLFLIRSNSIFG